MKTPDSLTPAPAPSPDVPYGLAEQDPRPGYTPVAKGLHWLMAAMLLGLLSLGIYMTDLPLSPEKLQLYAWHKWAGVTFFLLVWLRLVWRIRHRPPPLSEQMTVVQKRAAHLGHAALYLLMLAAPVSGWLMSSAKGFQTVWFGILPLPDLIDKNRELGDALVLLHNGLVVGLMVLAIGHIAFALRHHFKGRDGTLARMWFTPSSSK